MSRAHTWAGPLDLTNADDRFRARFWSKVDQRGPEECWPWLAYCKPNGYGQFVLHKGAFRTASRIALALTLGRPLENKEVACHHCDNPPCCNPAHLFVGDNRANILDSVAKGRANRARGVDTPSNRLTEQQVRDIRSHTGRHGLTTDLARQYGVAFSTIKKIRNYEKWKHVA